jgi:amino acid transporter
MGPFASFAISLSTICILAGGITSFPQGLGSVGGASIGLGWPLWCLFSLTVALTMAQVASAFPLAGGPYQWSAILGGRGWGWVTGCFASAGLVTVLAAINLGTCNFVADSLADLSDGERGEGFKWLTIGGAVLVTVSQALVIQHGIRLTARLIDLSGYLIMVVAAALTVSLLVLGMADHPLEPARLTEFSNYSGLPAGDAPVWPHTENVAWLFLLGLLLPAYTITGFDASAQTGEETLNPRHAVPRGIVRAVVVSGLAGWVMLCAVILAAPDLTKAAEAGDQSFITILRAVIQPFPLRLLLYVGVWLAMYLCGLASLTSASRMMFGFARDGGLPFSRALSRIGSNDSPNNAIWAVAVVTSLCHVCINYTEVAAVCAIFLYIAYVLPTVAGFLTYRRWAHLAEWNLGRWYRPLAVVCVLGCLGLIVLGMQPPNDIAAYVVAGLVVVLLALWFGAMRRHFPGPPRDLLDQLRPLGEKKP